MHTIWKFEIPIMDNFTLELPDGARFLDVQTQSIGIVVFSVEKPQAWFLLNPEAKKVTRHFVLVGTGHPVLMPEKLTYLGTFQIRSLVFHLFELI